MRRKPQKIQRERRHGQFQYRAQLGTFGGNARKGEKTLLLNSSSIKQNDSPVAIGGVGGSGTRLIARLLKELGFYMGSDLNEANDNLWFTLLFKREEILSVSEKEFEEVLAIFLQRMTQENHFTAAQVKLINDLAARDRPQYSTNWLRQRAHTLLAPRKAPLHSKGAWGWKEPNTHLVIDRLFKFLPNLKYIHVIRNGLDMAYSPNQNQLELWGAYFIGPDYRVLPYDSLRYWHKVHRRVLTLCRPREKRFFLLNYDQFCLEPHNGLKELLEFLEITASEAQINTLSKFVKIPDSMGRFKQHGTHLFHPADVAFAKALGFDTELNEIT